MIWGKIMKIKIAVFLIILTLTACSYDDGRPDVISYKPYVPVKFENSERFVIKNNLVQFFLNGYTVYSALNYSATSGIEQLYNFTYRVNKVLTSKEDTSYSYSFTDSSKAKFYLDRIYYSAYKERLKRDYRLRMGEAVIDIKEATPDSGFSYLFTADGVAFHTEVNYNSQDYLEVVIKDADNNVCGLIVRGRKLFSEDYQLSINTDRVNKLKNIAVMTAVVIIIADNNHYDNNVYR